MYADMFSVMLSMLLTISLSRLLILWILGAHIKVGYYGKFIVKCILHIFIYNVHIGGLYGHLKDLSLVLSGWVFF